MRWAFDHMQADDGGSVYLRLSTRPVAQPQRTLTRSWRPTSWPAATGTCRPAPAAEVAIVAMGAVTPEAIAAHESDARGPPRRRPAGRDLARPPARRLAGRQRSAAAPRAVDRAPPTSSACWRRCRATPRLVTVLDGHPAALSWLGAVRGQRVVPLGVEAFGQSGDIPDLYRAYKLDAAAIIDAVARSI